MKQKQLPPSLNEETSLALMKQWESEGYEFEGNGYLPYSEDDLRYEPELPRCPQCGDPGYFYILYKHPTLKEVDTSPEGETWEHSAHKCIDRCDECGYEWDSDWFNNEN